MSFAIRLTVVTSVLVSLLRPDAAASARVCVIFDDPADLYELSELVFRGTVLSVEPTGVVGEHVITHVARFQVDRVWKGSVARVLDVGTTEAFELGQEYVVFAGGAPRPSTSLLCQSAELVSNSRKKLQWLAARPSRPAG